MVCAEAVSTHTAMSNAAAEAGKVRIPGSLPPGCANQNDGLLWRDQILRTARCHHCHFFHGDHFDGVGTFTRHGPTEEAVVTEQLPSQQWSCLAIGKCGANVVRPIS